MQVGFDEAVKIFAHLPDRAKAPSLHPYYVLTDACRNPELEPAFWIYCEGSALFYYPFHMGRVTGTGFFDIQSPYPYGGPLYSTTDSGFLSRAWENYLSWCNTSNILVEFARFHPMLDNWQYYPGELQYMRPAVWLDLQLTDLVASYSPRVRTAIRKAVKNGLYVEWVNNLHAFDLFCNLYTKAMQQLQADSFYSFPTDYFQKMQQRDSSYLAFCHQGKKLLAAALFLRQSSIMEYHLSASTTEGSKLCATNLLLHQAALMSRDIGCRVLYLGGGTDNQSDNSLLFFKSGFSKNQASFYIGKMVHNPQAYQKMYNTWINIYGSCYDKVLFYRFPPTKPDCK